MAKSPYKDDTGLYIYLENSDSGEMEYVPANRQDVDSGALPLYQSTAPGMYSPYEGSTTTEETDPLADEPKETDSSPSSGSGGTTESTKGGSVPARITGAIARSKLAGDSLNILGDPTKAKIQGAAQTATQMRQQKRDDRLNKKKGRTKKPGDVMSSRLGKI